MDRPIDDFLNNSDDDAILQVDLEQLDERFLSHELIQKLNPKTPAEPTLPHSFADEEDYLFLHVPLETIQERLGRN